jgi:hypothetical protein
MPEMAHQSPGFSSKFLEALVDGHARAQERGGGAEIQLVGQTAHVIRIAGHVFGVSAVDRVAGHLLIGAERFPATDAMLAATAGRMEPWRADPVALLQVGHARADGGDLPHPFVARG